MIILHILSEFIIALFSRGTKYWIEQQQAEDDAA